MTTKRTIQFGKPWITEAEREAVSQVMKGDILAHGEQNKSFEREFGNFIGSGIHCVAVSSCMAALHLSYWQMGIGHGDEVIVTAQTHVATAHAVELVGAKPVFADCDPITGNIDPDRIESRITKKTKAIGLVHFLGIPCDMDRITKLAKDYNLKVIEDCALAIGTKYKGKHAGTEGDTGCFSFYPIKHITTGEGGMFITRHKELAERVMKARAFGIDKSFGERSVPGMYDVPTLGVNYRMSDINAAIGRVQLSRIAEILKRRQDNFSHLKDLLTDLPGVSILDSPHKESISSHYCLSILLNKPLSKVRTDIINALNQNGIGTSIYYPQPVPRMTYYKNKYGYNPMQFPNAERISDTSIAFPVGVHLNSDDMDYIAETFKTICKELPI